MLLFVTEKAEPTHGKPFATCLIIGLNTFCFLWMFLAWPGGDLGPSLEALRRVGFTPAHPTWISVLTASVAHGSFPHLASNMFVFWIFADNVEDVVGSWGLMLLYAAFGAASLGSHYVAFMDSTLPCVGASGAIAGIVGLYAVLFPRVRVTLWLLRQRLATTSAAFAIGLWLVQELVFATLSTVTDWNFGIAFWAHAGGMLCGAIAAADRVGLMMDAPRENLDKVLSLLPALVKPTIAPLADDTWVAVTTVIEESLVRELLPELSAAGARGIVEFPLNKIID